MLEYFSFKKSKKAQAEQKEKGKAAEVQVQEEPLLSPEDENFLGRIISAEGTPPPLPDRPSFIENPETGDSTRNQEQMVLFEGADIDTRHKSGSSERRKSTSSNRRRKSTSSEGKKFASKGKEKEKRSSVFSFLQRNKKDDGLEPKKTVSKSEAQEEVDDISRVLEDLNISASNNRAFSLSSESQNLVKQFTVILKDLVNGVPTAYDDLVKLLNDSQGQLAKSYEHMPSYMKKLITTLPNKLTSTLAPELLAVATEAQAHLNGGEPVEGPAKIDKNGGIKGAAQTLIGSIGLRELVTKPGAVVKLLKAIMNALKVRWPAFMGTNVLLSLALFVLLFVFWYCHKRGRETRIEREGKTVTVDSEGRIIELDDDPMLPAGPSEPEVIASASEHGVEGGISGPSSRQREASRHESERNSTPRRSIQYERERDRLGSRGSSSRESEKERVGSRGSSRREKRR